VAGYTWHLRVVEGADADAVVLANEAKGGAYAGQIVGLGGSDRWYQTQRRNYGEQCGLEHLASSNGSRVSGDETNGVQARFNPHFLVVAVLDLNHKLAHHGGEALRTDKAGTHDARLLLRDQAQCSA
jgi:hypothetical protein